jgi:hypothetical protein
MKKAALYRGRPFGVMPAAIALPACRVRESAAFGERCTPRLHLTSYPHSYPSEDNSLAHVPCHGQQANAGKKTKKSDPIHFPFFSLGGESNNCPTL